jgi:pimeloyl-CoA synthetase
MPKFFILLAFLALCALSCEKNDSTSSYDFARVYAELRIATQEHGETEDGKALRFQILERHGLSADSLEKKIEEIKKEPEKWIVFQKNVIAILDTISKLDTIVK